VLKYVDGVHTHFPTTHNIDFAEIGEMQTFLCAQSFQQRVCVGCLDGSVYFLNGPRLAQVVTAHARAVFAMDVSRKGQLLVTGGLDGMVRIWNEALDCINEFNMASVSKCHQNAVRAVAFSLDGTSVLIGLQGAEVLELGVKDAAVSEAVAIKGHTTQLLGLAAHPRSGLFVTTGDDAVLR